MKNHSDQECRGSNNDKDTIWHSWSEHYYW